MPISPTIVTSCLSERAHTSAVPHSSVEQERSVPLTASVVPRTLLGILYKICLPPKAEKLVLQPTRQ